MTPLPPELEALMPEPFGKIVNKYGDPHAFAERDVLFLGDMQKQPIGTTLFTADQVRQAMLDATERAAKKCDALADQLSMQWRQGHKTDSHLEGQSDGAFDCAAAIRGGGQG